MKVCHLTSVHGTFDTRIFLKECRSLAAAGFEMSLVSNHNKDEVIDGVHLIPVKRRSKGRFLRMFFYTWRIFFAALKTHSKIYHFHDPELFFVGICLRLLGKKVIFDVHENVAGQIKNKNWLPLRNIFAFCYKLIDWLSAKFFYLVLAENSYLEIYSKISKRNIVILNMPDIEFLKPYIKTDRKIENRIDLFYVGGVSFERGIDVIINALAILKNHNAKVHFHCIGPLYDNVKARIEALENYDAVKGNITFYGKMKLDEAYKMSLQCHVGLSILKPIENYKKSYSTKVFEYMAVGLPVITSDFDLYRNIVDANHCGFCIDPENAEKLAAVILEFMKCPGIIDEMGKRGILAAEKYYNWSAEAKKLVKFYLTL
ncbi:MAG: glycosyltransferase family 4 protein [Bacteroidetes bacterium]|nr:glycosyltransferase family 4 protein [Bacteroidota bacterium]